ncbi:MAG: hypothetical protein V4734_02555, partial [Terriglobus sp.]
MAIEQSVDGALWLGSRQGLYRFDGLHFERITMVDEDPWSPADIYALHAMPNGDLWIGQFTGGGVILLHEGKVTRYKEGLPRAGVTQFLVHPRGGFWASTTQGLARFEGGRFHPIGPEMGLPVGQSVTCIFDADGNLIVRTFTPGLFVLHPGSSRFEHVEDGQMGYQPFAMDRQHRIWESTKDGAQLRSGVGHGVQLTAPWTYPAFPPDIRFDQTGMLWATERGFGVRRVRLNGGSAEEEVFDEKDGLTSVQVMCNFVDKDDDVWVGTERGLDRFHAAALTKLDSAIGSAYLGTQPGPDGSAWIVAFTGGAWLRNAAGDLIPQSQLPQDVNRITAVAADGKGGIWLSAAGVVGHLDPTSWKPLPDSAQMAGKKITAIMNDQHGGFWAALNGTEIARYDSGTWSVLPTSNRLAVTALATDGAALYAGTRDGTLLSFDQDHQVRTYTPAVGAVTALTFSGGNLWIGGD